MVSGYSLLLRRFVFRKVSQRGERKNGDDEQGTMGMVKNGGLAASRSWVLTI